MGNVEGVWGHLLPREKPILLSTSGCETEERMGNVHNICARGKRSPGHRSSRDFGRSESDKKWFGAEPWTEPKGQNGRTDRCGCGGRAMQHTTLSDTRHFTAGHHLDLVIGVHAVPSSDINPHSCMSFTPSTPISLNPGRLNHTCRQPKC